jgi:hypothetical protein
MLLLEGCLSLILIHGDRDYADAAAEAAKRLLARPSKSRRRKPVAPGGKRNPRPAVRVQADVRRID